MGTCTGTGMAILHAYIHTSIHISLNKPQTAHQDVKQAEAAAVVDFCRVQVAAIDANNGSGLVDGSNTQLTRKSHHAKEPSPSSRAASTIQGVFKHAKSRQRARRCRQRILGTAVGTLTVNARMREC